MTYSKKYQQIERDKLQHLRDQEKRTNRERALLLSKQTAQRQKYVRITMKKIVIILSSHVIDRLVVANVFFIAGHQSI